MRLKDNTVRISNIHSQLAWAMFHADSFCRELLGYEMILTSVNDRDHKRASAHYRGMAFDFRTWTSSSSGQQITDSLRKVLAEQIAKRLGEDFDVIPEHNHIHVEYDPKVPT